VCSARRRRWLPPATAAAAAIVAVLCHSHRCCCRCRCRRCCRASRLLARRFDGVDDPIDDPIDGHVSGAWRPAVAATRHCHSFVMVANMCHLIAATTLRRIGCIGRTATIATWEDPPTVMMPAVNEASTGTIQRSQCEWYSLRMYEWYSIRMYSLRRYSLRAYDMRLPARTWAASPLTDPTRAMVCRRECASRRLSISTWYSEFTCNV
jgi:hypothetical protein